MEQEEGILLNMSNMTNHQLAEKIKKKLEEKYEVLRASSLIYLACPYGHADPEVQRLRFEAVNRAAAKLLNEGTTVFSPISHTRPIAMAAQLPEDWEFWQNYDREMLSHCSSLMVLKLDGWEKSIGVTAEIEIAKGWGMPVEYMEEVTE